MLAEHIVGVPAFSSRAKSLPIVGSASIPNFASADVWCSDMNWAILVFGVVIIIAFAWYFIRARHEYDGPVEYMNKDL